MKINGVKIEDTFAEAFKVWGARLIITAVNHKWAQTAAQVTTGFATSVIACGCEAGIEGEVEAGETPDGRPGISVLIFATGRKALEAQLLNRIGQCIMTCPTTACFNGLEGQEQLKIGGSLRYFGDGFQSSKRLAGRRFWRIPVMEGEFLIDETFDIQKGVGGGNFLVLGESAEATLAAAEAAAAAMRAVPGVALPFPGGVVRSGSKTTSRYKFLKAATNTAYCPTLRGQVDSALEEGVNSVLELVIDGLDEETVREATRVGVEAACRPGVVRITAGNYGGALGQYQIHLHDLFSQGGDR
jgi:formylmethanofuran--tetrahydromethanopterin N-formyltransferase